MFGDAQKRFDTVKNEWVYCEAILHILPRFERLISAMERRYQGVNSLRRFSMSRFVAAQLASVVATAVFAFGFSLFGA